MLQGMYSRLYLLWRSCCDDKRRHNTSTAATRRRSKSTTSHARTTATIAISKRTSCSDSFSGHASLHSSSGGVGGRIDIARGHARRDHGT